MTDREPGDDDWSPDDDEGEDDEGALVPLGDALAAMDAEREAAARQTAQDLLTRDRSPPHALDAERAVLGALLMDANAFDAVVDEGLQPSHFFRQQHGVIFKTICAMRQKAQPTDTITVVDALLAQGQLDNVGGAAAISQLEALLPTTHHCGPYARLIVEKAQARELITVASNLVTEAFAQRTSIGAMIEKAQQQLADAATSATRMGTHISVLAKRADERLSAGHAGVRKIPTGIKALDQGLLGGLPHGAPTVIAALPGIGKSSLSRLFLRHVAGNLQIPSVLFTSEMSEDDSFDGLAEQEAGLHLPQSYDSVSGQTAGRIKSAIGALSDWPVFVEDSAMTAEEISAKIRRYVREHGIAFALIDYVGDVELSPGYGDDHRGWKHVSMVLRACAKETGIVLLEFSQLNPPKDAAEETTGAWPRVKHIPLTQQFGKDAAVTVFAQRHVDKQGVESDVTRLMLRGKNRFGKGGKADAFLRYSKETTQLIEVSADGLLPDGAGAAVLDKAGRRPKSAKPVAFGANDRRIHGVDDAEPDHIRESFMADEPRGRG